MWYLISSWKDSWRLQLTTIGDDPTVNQYTCKSTRTQLGTCRSTVTCGFHTLWNAKQGIKNITSRLQTTKSLSAQVGIFEAGDAQNSTTKQQKLITSKIPPGICFF